MKNRERAEVAEELVLISTTPKKYCNWQGLVSEELMTKTKKNCGMLKSLRLENPSLQ